MSATFFEMLKYAATGIASPSMTDFDKMRAMAGGSSVRSITGVPPLSFTGNGKPLVSWSMLGNGSQTGTPTPDNPVMPDFVGVRTGNLFDISSVIYGVWTTNSGGTGVYVYAARSIDIPSNQITVSFNGSVFPYSYSIIWVDSDGEFIIRDHVGASTQIRQPQTFTPPSNATKFYIQLANGTDATNPITEEQIESYKLMLNLGSTALPYEPYGYKIPITCAGQTVPVYLGQVSTVRRIRKLVLTGEENITMPATSSFQILGVIQWGSINGFCTHYPQITWDEATYVTKDGFAIRASSGGADRFRICDRSITTVTDFKYYLAQQYAAGTPVCIWYVLAEPETTIVNEPLCKIGDYADELRSTDAAVTIPTVKGQNLLTVDTTLPPSSLTITGYISQ